MPFFIYIISSRPGRFLHEPLILSNIDKSFLSDFYQKTSLPKFELFDPVDNPETSDFGETPNESGWGYVIATSTDSRGKPNESWGLSTMGEFVGFSIFHGMGHNAGFAHNPVTDKEERGYMNEANSTRRRLIHTHKGDVNDLIRKTSTHVKDKVKNRFN